MIKGFADKFKLKNAIISMRKKTNKAHLRSKCALIRLLTGDYSILIITSYEPVAVVDGL